MKMVFALTTGFAVMLTAASVSHAQGAGSMAMRMETIQGVLVDSKCYGMIPQQNTGDDHMVAVNGAMTSIASCATICANLGIPVELKTADNRTIVLAAPTSQLSEHMAEQVALEGMYSTDRATFIVMRVIPEDGEPYDITTMM